MANLFHKIIHPKKRAFLAAYALTGNTCRAAEAAGVDRGSHYFWYKSDEEYKAAFAVAEELACRELENEAVRRATEGVDEPVFHQGKECGKVKRYSDTLLIFLMKGAMPQKYRDNASLQLTGPRGGAIEVSNQFDLKGATTEDLVQMKSLLEKINSRASTS